MQEEAEEAKPAKVSDDDTGARGNIRGNTSREADRLQGLRLGDFLPHSLHNTISSLSCFKCCPAIIAVLRRRAWCPASFRHPLIPSVCPSCVVLFALRVARYCMIYRFQVIPRMSTGAMFVRCYRDQDRKIASGFPATVGETLGYLKLGVIRTDHQSLETVAACSFE